MTPTRWRDLIFSALSAAVLVWAVLLFSYNSLPPLPRSVTASLLVVAAAGWSSWLSLRSRLEGRPGAMPVTPLQIARFAALAKALSIAGAFAIGGWLGVVARVAGNLDVSDYRKDAITASIGLIPSIGVMVSGLLLERLCRAKERPDDDDSR